MRLGKGEGSVVLVVRLEKDKSEVEDVVEKIAERWREVFIVELRDDDPEVSSSNSSHSESWSSRADL